MKVKYIGKRDWSLEPNTIYECKKTTDTLLGECYSIKDESGDWYLVSKKSFAEKYIIIGE